MEKKIKIKNRVINCKIKRQRGWKNVTLRVLGPGEVRLSAPLFLPLRNLEKILTEKEDWIDSCFVRLDKTKPDSEKEKLDYQKNKEKARALAWKKIGQFSKHYNLSPEKIYIRNQKSRWGSCSSKGNLNFNYKILRLPARLSDYIIVHELCHLRELNHSSRFWELVSQTIPDYKERRKELRNWKLRN